MKPKQPSVLASFIRFYTEAEHFDQARLQAIYLAGNASLACLRSEPRILVQYRRAEIAQKFSTSTGIALWNSLAFSGNIITSTDF